MELVKELLVGMWEEMFGDEGDLEAAPLGGMMGDVMTWVLNTEGLYEREKAHGKSVMQLDTGVRVRGLTVTWLGLELGLGWLETRSVQLLIQVEIIFFWSLLWSVCGGREGGSEH